MRLGPIEDLASTWNEEASLLRKRGLESLAQFAESLAEELLETLKQLQTEPLTLAQAAELSGYSVDHLGRLLREGKIPNAGRPGAPTILRSDVPLKAKQRVSKPTKNGHLSKRQVVQSIIEGVS